MCTAVQAGYTGEGSRKRSELGPNARQCGAAERTSGSRNWLQSRSRNIRWLWGTPTSTARSRSLDSWAASGGGRSGARREACGACFGGVSSCQLKSLPGRGGQTKYFLYGAPKNHDHYGLSIFCMDKH